MDDLFLRLQALLETPLIALEDPVTVSQIPVLIAMVAVSVLILEGINAARRRRRGVVNLFATRGSDTPNGE